MRGKDFKYDDEEKKAFADGAVFAIILIAAGYLVYEVLANLSYIESLIA